MKETILSNCEKAFVLRAIAEGKRLDGRQLDECRTMQICFGTDWGCCQVSLGETKVLAQVSCEVQQPKATRPNEGLLFLNIELSPMGAPHFEVGRHSELAVQLNRLLEKCIKDSRCVDLESLCIVAEEKVWAIRVDINVLNHEGNLVDAASAAALTALCHFRHPDVTITGEQTIIHDQSERDPIPICLHHHPVCVSYATFNKGESVIADPTVIEERVSEAQIVFGVNAYRELCGLHVGGKALATSDIVVFCANRAAKRAADVVQLIKIALEEDANARAGEKPVGFAECTREGKILALSHDRLAVQLDACRMRNEAWKLVHGRQKRIRLNSDGTEDEDRKDDSVMEDAIKKEEQDEEEASILSLGRGSAELKIEGARTAVGEGGENQWVKMEHDTTQAVESHQNEESSEEDTSSSSDIVVVKEITHEQKYTFVESIELSGDSEEEETMTLQAADISFEKKGKNKGKSKKQSENTVRGWYPMQQW